MNVQGAVAPRKNAKALWHKHPPPTYIFPTFIERESDSFTHDTDLRTYGSPIPILQSVHTALAKCTAVPWIKEPYTQAISNLSLRRCVDDERFEDLRCQIYPQSGTNTDIKVDIAATVIDRRVKVDNGGNAQIIAGRPQPPPASCFATCCFGICAMGAHTKKSVPFWDTLSTVV